MTFALFLGCHIPVRLKQYESSARSVLKVLGVEVRDIKDFNCCGYPLRNIDFKAAVLSAARNLALAETQGLPLLMLCKCGFGMLKYADHVLREDRQLKDDINAVLAREGLELKKGVSIKHLLSVLYHDVGLKALQKAVTRPYKGLKIATHYGCHALRPSEVVGFDDPINPRLFDELVTVTGAVSIDWEARLDCCGAPLFGSNDELSMDLTRKKIINAKRSGADFLCDACSYCHMQFDEVQAMMNGKKGKDLLPAILYPQLLGLSMGLDEKALGLGMNRMDISKVVGFLS